MTEVELEIEGMTWAWLSLAPLARGAGRRTPGGGGPADWLETDWSMTIPGPLAARAAQAEAAGRTVVFAPRYRWRRSDSCAR